MEDDYTEIELDGTLIKESDKGCQIETATGPQWFPKRYVTWVGDGRSFTLPSWIAKERGLV